jgi:hypothetical protein
MPSVAKEQSHLFIPDSHLQAKVLPHTRQKISRTLPFVYADSSPQTSRIPITNNEERVQEQNR